jgi:translation initiation factor 1
VKGRNQISDMAMKAKNKGAGLVYSTESGKLCPDCNKPAVKCICRKKQSSSKSDGIVRLMRETKGRKGKAVTLITGLPLDNEGLKKLTKSLKQKCGSGGSLKNDVIEIQGDHRDVLEKELGRLGYKVKRAGG